MAKGRHFQLHPRLNGRAAFHVERVCRHEDSLVLDAAVRLLRDGGERFALLHDVSERLRVAAGEQRAQRSCDTERSKCAPRDHRG